jgi:hypothetical protein
MCTLEERERRQEDTGCEGERESKCERRNDELAEEGNNDRKAEGEGWAKCN